MLPITGQKLALADIHEGALFQAALIVVAQLVMIPMAIVVGRNADRWGRKPLFVLAFLVLPVRGLLFRLGKRRNVNHRDPDSRRCWRGASGSPFPIMVADLTPAAVDVSTLRWGRRRRSRGSEPRCRRPSPARSWSSEGYDAAMTVLTAIALVALVLLVFGVPETAPRAAQTPRHDVDPPGDPRGERYRVIGWHRSVK